MAWDHSSIRGQFPFFRHKPSTVYLDSAATAQKPTEVLDAMQRFYEEENANVHRGVHGMTERATTAYEAARRSVQRFIKADSAEEIIFTKGCTESINLVATSWGRANVRKGDVIALSRLEHHSNILPWMQLCEEQGIHIEWIDIDEYGRVDLGSMRAILRKGNVKLVGITAQSNVLGVCPPLRPILDSCREAGALVLVDGAQYLAHHALNVQELGIDFLAFSGHKLYGPTGIGVLYGKQELLHAMRPYQTGGGMVATVTDDAFVPLEAPHKFEAGTPPVAEAIGFAAALDWMNRQPWADIQKHEQFLIATAIQELSAIPHLRILGPGAVHDVSGCVSFAIDGIHPHDLTDILGSQGIILRAGHQCAQPLHRKLGITASSRLSIGVYTTEEEIRRVAPAIREVAHLLVG